VEFLNVRRVPSLLNASRCIAAFSLLLGLASVHASAGTAVKLKDNTASSPSVSSTASKPPDLVLLALGMVGIGLHGLGRARRHR